MKVAALGGAIDLAVSAGDAELWGLSPLPGCARKEGHWIRSGVFSLLWGFFALLLLSFLIGETTISTF